MAKFESKNETFAYLVGKDIAEIKAKIEGIGTTSGGLDVLKVITPAATNEDINSGALCVVTLPKEFQGALLLYEQNYSWNFAVGDSNIGLPLETTETERFIVKLSDFKNPKKTIRADIKKATNGSMPSEA